MLTMRLPDPAQMFGLPAGLARPLSRRMRAVNAELDKIAAHYGTLHWDASTRPGDLRPAQLVGGPAAPQRARAPADRLPALGPARRRRARGRRPARPRAGRPGADPARRLPVDGDQGHPWFLRRSVDLIPYLLFMAAREALVEPREWTWASARRSGAHAGRARSPPRCRLAPLGASWRRAGGVAASDWRRVGMAGECDGTAASRSPNSVDKRAGAGGRPGEMRPVTRALSRFRHLRFDGYESRGGTAATWFRRCCGTGCSGDTGARRRCRCSATRSRRSRSRSPPCWCCTPGPYEMGYLTALEWLPSLLFGLHAGRLGRPAGQAAQRDDPRRPRPRRGAGDHPALLRAARPDAGPDVRGDVRRPARCPCCSPCRTGRCSCRSCRRSGTSTGSR